MDFYVSIKKMHILFLTDNFPPEVNAPASRTFEHCREWVKSGHRVSVITCVPNFPKGKVYPGYKNRLWQSEMMNGIRVIRVWTYIAANAGFVKRIIDYVSYMISAILASPFVKKPDVVVATSPLLFTACAGYVSGRLHRIPFVFELRDIWPESIKAVGAMDDSMVTRFFERIEMFLYHRAARIISVTRSFKNILIKRGIDPAKIEFIPNGVDLSRFQPMPKDAELEAFFDLKGKFVAGYIGTHGMAHSLETILDAAAIIRDTNHGDDFRFLFLGDGARKDYIEQKAREMGLDNVLFVDSVSKDLVPLYWSMLDVSIIHLKKTDLFRNVIPSKLFESMGMGIPILHGVAGESAEIVTKERVGMVFEPENEAMLCEQLIQLRNNSELFGRLKKHCLRTAVNYDRTKLAGMMLEILERLVISSVENSRWTITGWNNK